MSEKVALENGNWTSVPNSFIKVAHLLPKRDVNVFLYLCMSVDQKVSKKRGYQHVSRSIPVIAEKALKNNSKKGNKPEKTAQRALEDLNFLKFIKVVERRYNDYNSYAICSGIEDDTVLQDAIQEINRNTNKNVKTLRHHMSKIETPSVLSQDTICPDTEHPVSTYQDVVSQESDSISQNVVSQDFVINPLTEDNIENELNNIEDNKEIDTPVEDINLDGLKGISLEEEITFPVKTNIIPETPTCFVPPASDKVYSGVTGTNPMANNYTSAEYAPEAIEDEYPVSLIPRKSYNGILDAKNMGDDVLEYTFCPRCGRMKGLVVEFGKVHCDKCKRQFEIGESLSKFRDIDTKYID